jgi:hypothetical protein
MRPKRLSNGQVAYYWEPPTWAKKAGCLIKAEALGVDYGAAKQRCDTILNVQFDAWRTGVQESVPQISPDTFDWLVSLYKSSPKFCELPTKTQKSYDAALALVSKFGLKDGRHFGALDISDIKPGVVDKLYAKLKLKPDGTQRVRTAFLAMQVSRRAWNIAHRTQPDRIPTDNPFERMGISYKAKSTRPVSFAELQKFVEAADKAGAPSIGTAAMIAFFWLQRQVDILSRLSWAQYRPADAQDCARVFHYKTGELVDIPLYDSGGALWPELMARLDQTPRRGTLIVTRDELDRSRKAYLPWQEDYFRHRVAEIRRAAGIDPEVKFMGLRHGGNVEGADADLTDAQLRALSGHRTTAALLRYAQVTKKQRQIGARKRLEARTK